MREHENAIFINNHRNRNIITILISGFENTINTLQSAVTLFGLFAEKMYAVKTDVRTTNFY